MTDINSESQVRSGPIVSVVTPFFNTREYLEQCIKSVLAQSFENFEFILLDNCSTDGSFEIAKKYAKSDRRIRLESNKQNLGQVENYNRSLTLISPASIYCKMVQADDWIFPNCLAEMVSVSERYSNLALVASYRVEERRVLGDGIPVETEHVDGIEMGRRHLLERLSVFGSPTTVMYRSDLVRSRPVFFQPGSNHEDTDVCFELLKGGDLGFVHQVLSFTRTDNVSISSSTRQFDTGNLDFYLRLVRHGDTFLNATEAEPLMSRARSTYYRQFARGLLRGGGRGYWNYHRDGLLAAGQPVPKARLLPFLLLEFANIVLNPAATLSAIVRRLRKERSRD